MTARSTSRSRASFCCPCGLVPVVTVAAGTTWGHATPCNASRMMLVLLYGLAHNTCPTLKPRLVFSTLKPILAEHPHTQTDRFFFLDVAIRNSLRSNNFITQINHRDSSFSLEGIKRTAINFHIDELSRKSSHPPIAGRGAAMAAASGSDQCHHCQGYGHFRKGCPKLVQKKRPTKWKKARNLAAAVVLRKSCVRTTKPQATATPTATSLSLIHI